ncbi:protein c-Fos-like [Saccostrea echinata]|uniref:protein c-Fos-like n=1 Tax=Saccostrea echinata TaxID=191078 RepID=UPI002A817AD1|nr:protein c-Fos-like [Saccostrea echinata]
MAKTIQGGNKWTQASSVTEPLNLSKPKSDQPTDTVKQTLKSLIKSRRIAEGKSDLHVDFTVEKSRCELTPEEKTKQRERKEQNRRAAMRCRERKKEELKCLQKEENSLRQRRQILMARVENLLIEKEKLLQTIRSSGHVSSCSCANSEGGCINCLSISNTSVHSESSSSPRNGPEAMIIAPDSCGSDTDSGNEDDDDDDDEADRLYIDTSAREEDSEVLDLSFSKEKYVHMELTDSDSQPCSSQESTSSQKFSLYKVVKPVALYSNSHSEALSKISVSSVFEVKEEQTEMEDSDYVMSSQESTHSIYSSQDSIDGSFLKHGGRTCDVSCD